MTQNYEHPQERSQAKKTSQAIRAALRALLNSQTITSKVHFSASK